ncbi:MAG TPA: hypothetical protein VFS69_01315 [Sphingomicrobium sp.]|nr:hypothetical protein [Sphingomicrobium sp.]
MRKAAALTLALALALAACRGEKSTSQQQGQVTKQTVLTGKEQGVTPMKDRVAVIGLLNKRNGMIRVDCAFCSQSFPIALEDVTGR